MAQKRIKTEPRSREQMMQEYQVFRLKDQLVNLDRHQAVQDMYSKFYGGIDPRRRQEKADGGMVYEDNKAPANLSAKPLVRQYPRAGFYSNPFIQDSTLED